ncbi:MAG: NAD(P)H-hydrate dehydratase [Gammaproteobacteria bacterium]|nr:NAD(P)H-hydrate dehydratase [Gammaproteobacteria bacterium]
MTEALYQKLEWQPLSQQFKARDRAAHKGDFGHVLVIGGDYGMAGAVRMAAEAALRVGAGLVSVATHAENVAVVNASRPEIMCHAVDSADALNLLLNKASVIVLGPGLGKSDWSVMLFETAIKTAKPMVIDADALYFLSANKSRQNNWIVTPHPGEAARLLHCTVKEVQTERLAAAQNIVKLYGGIAVLKGAGTIVATENNAFICEAGNPGMASGGMGDVLSGVLGGLLAQKFSLESAAKTGVLLHAMAADQAALEGGERGLLATDLMPYLRQWVNLK